MATYTYIPGVDQDKNMLYTRSELVKLHRKFSHPSAKKLFDLLNLGRPLETDSQTRQIIKINNCFNTYQRFTNQPIRFKASLSTEENIVLGGELSMDLMFLDGKAVVHIVNTATRFSAGTYLDSHDANYRQSVEGE